MALGKGKTKLTLEPRAKKGLQRKAVPRRHAARHGSPRAFIFLPILDRGAGLDCAWTAQRSTGPK